MYQKGDSIRRAFQADKNRQRHTKLIGTERVGWLTDSICGFLSYFM